MLDYNRSLAGVGVLLIVARLLASGASVQAFDPTVHEMGPTLPSGLEVRGDAAAAAAGAHVLAVLTEWEDFRFIEPSDIAAVLVRYAVVDGRNVLDRTQWAHAGFAYEGVGRA